MPEQPSPPTAAVPSPRSPLLTPEATAVIFSVTTRTLTRWVASGTLTCTRTAGGHRRYSAVEVEAVRRRFQREELARP